MEVGTETKPVGSKRPSISNMVERTVPQEPNQEKASRFKTQDKEEENTSKQKSNKSTVSCTHGHHFFRRGGEDFFSCVHGSKMAIGEVMFLAAIAWVKRGGRGGREKF